MTTVADMMHKGLFSVGPSTTVAEAATMMGERRVGSALVMEGDALLGIFTERDIVRALGEHFDAAKHQVSEWMTRNPITVPPDTPARDALKTMLDGGFRHLPVLDGEQVIGIVSMRDLSRLEAEA
ncbi:MAG TPA: CBS domain-containing protein [Actinomycetota bacterium]|jgi:CBS domain-containing protein|nr:CBS domain-containing protein [Actinomycetota bacterium]